jgi:hypothetical protein
LILLPVTGNRGAARGEGSAMRRRGCGTGRLVFTERRREARRRAAVESGGGGGGAGTAGGGRRVELGLGHGGLELAAVSWVPRVEMKTK